MNNYPILVPTIKLLLIIVIFHGIILFVSDILRFETFNDHDYCKIKVFYEYDLKKPFENEAYIRSYL